jgi:Lrp/AsnC family transcriptional regulator, leucine-responsive regulatory protein
MKLDDKDRIIISMYAEDPDISQEKIATRIHMTQPAVAARVAWLRKNGGLEKLLGVNPMKMGMFLAKVDVSSTDPHRILKRFHNCPYFANGFSTSGQRNLCLLFFSESVSTLESIINCHIHQDPSVRAVDFDIVINAEKDYIIPIKLKPELCDEAPCGMEGMCFDCPNYKEEKCMGCPATGQYRGCFYDSR